MTETVPETENTYTPEDLQKMWDSLPEQFQTAISNVNALIDEHNADVALIKASKESDTTKLLHEIREQNTQDDPELAKYNAEITKLNERIEALIAKANKVAEKYLPKSITEEEVTAATERTKKSAVSIRDAIKGIETFETLMPGVLVLTPHIKEAQSTRGLALIGSRSGSGQTGTWRPRLSAIYLINDAGREEIIEREITNTENKKVKKSTMNILAAELNKRLETKRFNTVMLQEAYLKAITDAGGDKDNVPDEVTFTLPHTYTDPGTGTETTMDLKLKVVK